VTQQLQQAEAGWQGMTDGKNHQHSQLELYLLVDGQPHTASKSMSSGVTCSYLE